jgi:hypothetical protein
MDESRPSENRGGLFFEKRAQSTEARFFRDLPGRDVANFFNADTARNGGAGHHKTATPDPTYLWDEPVADGFHRPAREQPEPIEHGGERFHASDADYGTGVGVAHSVVVPDKKSSGTSGSLGKHAAAATPRFLGTSFEKSALSLPSGKEVGDAYDKAKDAGARALDAGQAFGEKAIETGKELGGKILDRAARYGTQALETLKGSGQGLGDKADEALDAASKHPLGAAAMLGGAGVLGAKAVGGAARGAASLLHRRKPVPKGLVARGLAGLSHLIRG